jgi:hypothetical protein
MIGQYLSNKNKNATVAKSEIFSELNKAQVKNPDNNIIHSRLHNTDAHTLTFQLWNPQLPHAPSDQDPTSEPHAGQAVERQ